jgi:hypothetical protein
MTRESLIFNTNFPTKASEQGHIYIYIYPNLGVRIVNIFALATVVLIAIYILLVRGFGDFLVRSTQSVVIGILFPKSSAVLKEF